HVFPARIFLLRIALLMRILLLRITYCFTDFFCGSLFRIVFFLACCFRPVIPAAPDRCGLGSTVSFCRRTVSGSLYSGFSICRRVRKYTSAESSVYNDCSGQKERHHGRSYFSEKNISHIHLSFCRIMRPFCKKLPTLINGRKKTASSAHRHLPLPVSCSV